MSDYIPPELIPNIIARLPIGDVLRCTSVCKSWYHLITSSSFISSHLNLSISNTQPRLLVKFYQESSPCQYYLHRDNQTFDEIQEIEFPWTHCKGLSVQGSSNGLFCYCYSDAEKIIVWNPSLKKSLLLSPTKKLSPGDYDNVGFGFIPCTGNYKIVRVLCARNSDGFVVTSDVEIYDLCTHSWRDVDAGEFSYVLDADINYPPVLKGIVHWTAFNLYPGRGPFVKLIASFDLGSEKFGSLMLPKSLQIEESDRLRVSVLKYSLCMIHRKADFTSIFVMKEYGIAESWEKLFNIDYHLRPLYFRENGEILSEVDSSPTGNDLVSYDPKASKVMDLGVHNGGFIFFAYDYVDNLFLIESNCQG